MSEATVSTLLAVAALASVFASLAIVAAIDAPGAANARKLASRHVQTAAFAVAFVATAASLYYSEHVGFIPCEFCWFQRIMMYPLATVLLVAVISRERLPSRYIVALATIGLALSIYHFQLQLVPEQGTVCTSGVPCTTKWVEEFNLVTIPFMAGSGFASILLLYLARWRAERLQPD